MTEFSGFLLGALFALLCLFLLVYVSKRLGKPGLFLLNLFAAAEQYQDKSASYQLDVFPALNIGLLVFDRNSKLLFSSDEALKLLLLDTAPATLTDFLKNFGHVGGMKSLFFIPNSKKSITFQLDEEHWVKLSVKVKYQGKDLLQTTVVVQDFSDQEQQNKQRKEFVANVSHELKTPITTIKAYTESLLDWGLAEKTDEQVRSDIEKIKGDVYRMENLVGDLLLLSSIDSKRRVPDIQLIEVETVIKSLVERLSMQADERNMTLNYHILNKVPMIFAETESLERAFGNIIINAIKYGVQGGKIDIYVSCLIDDVTIKISDNGIGIAPENLPYIFDRFYRVDKTGARLKGGTGLGLSIVKELVKMHHGEILVHSVLGRGTEFTIVLPSEKGMYREVISNKAARYSEDPLYMCAVKELLLQAKEFAMDVNEVGELSEYDLKVIMEQ